VPSSDCCSWRSPSRLPNRPPRSRSSSTSRAGVAFSALTDALTVSLFALIPGIDLGLAALVVAIGGIASCIAFIIVSVRAGELRQRWHKVRLLVLQGLVFAYQLVVAVALIGDDHDGTAIKTLAVLNRRLLPRRHRPRLATHRST